MSTKIQWTEETWNPVTGCTRVSDGCRNCYAERISGSLSSSPRYAGLTVLRNGRARWTNEIRLREDQLDVPIRLRKPRMIFTCSMSDLFHERVPFEFIDRVFGSMLLTPRHTFQVLTKRPERMAEWAGAEGCSGRVQNAAERLATKFGVEHGLFSGLPEWPAAHIWLGTSVEDQLTAQERIPWLMRTLAPTKFLSCEPLLEGVSLTPFLPPMTAGLSWVIVGGESGADSRPCQLPWIRRIVGQCRAATVPVFVKQLGSCPYDPDRAKPRLSLHDSKGGNPVEWPPDLAVREMPQETCDVC